MANEKFTELPTVTQAQLTDIIAAVQSGVSVQETLSQVVTLARDNIVLNYSGDPNGNVPGTTYQLLYDTSGNNLWICTTSGTAATAVWQTATAITLPLNMSSGGTGKNLTPLNGGVVYSSATTMDILPPVGGSNRPLMSGAAAAPSWSTASYPPSTNANKILYSTSDNVVGELTSTNSAALVVDNGGTPVYTAALANGKLVIGVSGGTPQVGSILGGTNVTVNESPGSITINATGGGAYKWNEVTGTSQGITVNNGYIANNGGLVTLTLPPTSAVGDHIAIVGKGAGGWLIAQNAGQNIQIGSVSSTGGIGGSVASSNQFDSVELVCTTANTTWTTLGGPQGNLTIV